jgi:type IV secretion system protein VirB11
MEHYEISELTADEIVNIGERVAATTNQFVNRSSPILSAALPTGERIQVVLPPAAANGGAVSIRKQVISNFTLDDYRDQGSLDQVTVAVGGLSETDHALIEQLSLKTSTVSFKRPSSIACPS